MSSGSGRFPAAFGDFRVVRLIASGGMGAVYEVEHRETRAHYAIKTILRAGDQKARARFRREAELLARCDRHPGIVKAHSLGEAPDGALYIVLDLVSGEGLDAILERERRLSPERTAALGRAVALALAHVHAQGIVHRDVKPSNILIDAAGPRLTDFGLSTAEDVERLTRTGQFLGTPFYVSPEQATRGEVGPAADIFSLGAVLFHALSGDVPLRAESYIAFFSKLASKDPVEDVRTVFPEAPAGLAAILARALAKDPARRYASAHDMALDLERFERGGSTQATAEADAIRLRRGIRLLASLVVVAACLALVALLLSRFVGTRALLATAESELALGEAAWKESAPGDAGTKARLAALEHARSAIAAIGSDAPLAGGDGALVRERARALLADASSAVATHDLESGEPGRAVATLRAAAALGPLPGKARLVLSRALLATHDARGAADEAAAAAAALPENHRSEALELEGDAALEAGDAPRAVAAFSGAFGLRPGSVELRAKRGGAAALAGDATTAASDLAALVPDPAKLARDRTQNARLAALAPALYARFLAAKSPDPRDVEGAWRLAPPPAAQRLEIAQAIVRWQSEDSKRVVGLLGSAVGAVKFNEKDQDRLAVNLRVGTIARELWPGAPLPWEMLAVIRALFREINPDTLERIGRDLGRDAPGVPTLPFLVATARRHKEDREGTLRALLEAVAAFPEVVPADDEEPRVLASEILDTAGQILADITRPLVAANEIDPFLRFGRLRGTESVFSLIGPYARLDMTARTIECLDAGWTGVERLVASNHPHAPVARTVLESTVTNRVEALHARLPDDPGPVLAIARRAATSPAIESAATFAAIAGALGSYGRLEEAEAFARDVTARDAAAGSLVAGEVVVGQVLSLLKAGKVAEAKALADERGPALSDEQRLMATASVLESEHRWADEATLLEGHTTSLRLMTWLGMAVAHLGQENRAREVAAQASSRFRATAPWLARFDAARTLDELERKSGARAALEAVGRIRAPIGGPAPELKGFIARAQLAVGDDAAAVRGFEEVADMTAVRPRLQRFFPLAPKKTGFLRPRVLAGPEAAFHLYGPVGQPFTIADVSGPVAVEPTSGIFPAVLTVRAKGATASLAAFSFRAVPGSGEPAVATGTLSFATWKGTIVPRKRDDESGAWRDASGDPFETTDLWFPWGEAAASAHTSFNDFALSAACELSVPAGTYSIETFSDDGVRVFVDDVLALDFWTEHAAARKDATIALTAGKHRVRVEYFQAGPPAYLRVRFGAPPP